MTAVVNYGPKDYRLESVERPVIGDDEILLRIDAAGICGSDAKCYQGSDMFWAGADPWVKTPVIPGHEFVGTVAEIGPVAAERYGLEVGDKAIAEQIYPCNKCRFCLRGQYWMCEPHDIYGFQKGATNGAWADYMKLSPNSRVHKVPNDMPLDSGVLIEPLSCAIHAVERGSIQLGDTVVLAGAGPLGLLMVQLIKLKNPGKLIVLDARDDRLEVALALGADLALNVTRDDVVGTTKGLTGGYGCDVFIEAAGAPGAVEVGLQAIRRLGTLVIFGVFGSDVTVDWSIIGDRKELDIFGAHLGPYRYPLAIEYLYNGTVAADRIVTHRLPLSEFARGLDLVKAGESIKVILVPGDAS